MLTLIAPGYVPVIQILTTKRQYTFVGTSFSVSYLIRIASSCLDVQRRQPLSSHACNELPHRLYQNDR